MIAKEVFKLLFHHLKNLILAYLELFRFADTVGFFTIEGLCQAITNQCCFSNKLIFKVYTFLFLILDIMLLHT